MSVKGLEQSERIARRTQSKVKQALDRTAEEVKAEIDKLQYLLSDRQAARRWASSPANAEKLAQIRSRMNEVEQLYMDAGDTEAARIFRRRTEAALKQRLTNLKAAELDVKTIMAKGRQQGEAQVLSGLTEVRREGAVGEMYNQARSAGGFLVNFGRQYLNDVVTLQTKAAGSKTIGKYMANIYTQYEDQIKDVFVNGIVRGDSYEMMTDGLANATGLSKRKSELVIRTEANAIFNESIKDVIQENPLVKGYRFRAVLDAKTSKICQKHDGEYIPKDKIKPGVNFPPLHPNCRSTVTTVLVDEDERKDTMQRYTKNGRNQWEKVPPGMTYQEYRDKFGFANSKNPRTYNPETRDIHDKTLARITVPQYKGYVKPSRSATARIQKMLKAYREGDEVYTDCLKTNTGFDKVAKALARQAQAESGFDGLPLQQTAEQFNKTVEKNGYRVLWRQFGREEDEASFLEGDGLYGKGSISFGAGTYAYNEAPTKESYGRKPLRMALKSPEEKILRFVGAETDKDIRNAQTPDDRINEALKAFQPAERKDAFAALAVEYGYDAVDARSEAEGTNYTIVLNRTALVVEAPEAVDLPKVKIDSSLPKYSETVTNVAKISPTDPRIVDVGGTRIIPGFQASAAKIDHVLGNDVSLAAHKAYESAIAAEPAISEQMIAIADEYRGRLDGIEYSVKTGHSVKDKLERRLADAKVHGKELTDAEAIESMSDLVRYTLVVEHDDIVPATRTTIANLEKHGFEVVELDNRYKKGASYKGVHLGCKTKNGMQFEVQVHSDISLKAKAANHPLYEEARKVGTPDERKVELLAKMAERVELLVPDPKGIKELKGFDRRKK